MRDIRRNAAVQIHFMIFSSQCKPKESEQCVVVGGGTAESIVVAARAVEALVARVLNTHSQVQPRPRDGIELAERDVLEQQHITAAVRRSVEASGDRRRGGETHVRAAGGVE